MNTPPVMIDLPNRLVGERIVVRPWRAGDGQGLFEAIDESREHLIRFLPWPPFHETPESTEAMVRKWEASWILKEDFPLAIYDLEEKRVLGGTGLHRIDWNVRAFEIGYWIRHSEEGKGYVTEAVRLLIKLLRDHCEPNRILIRTASGNDRSTAIPLRLGFKLEGVLRNSILSPSGELRDINMFSLIPGEFDI